MPYIIRKFQNGYKVCKVDSNKCFSKEPIPLIRAKKQLKAIGMSGHSFINLFHNEPLEYLRRAKIIAKKQGYNPKLLSLSNKPNKKLNYNNVHFGASNYNDFIIYSDMAKKGLITKEQADKHRQNYLSRATKIKGDWKENIESPNNLAIRILW